MTSVAPLNDDDEIQSNNDTVELTGTRDCPAGLESLLNNKIIEMKKPKPGCLSKLIPFCMQSDNLTRFDISHEDTKEAFLTSVEESLVCNNGYSITVTGTARSLLSMRAKREYPFCGLKSRDKGLCVEAPKGVVIGYVTTRPDPVKVESSKVESKKKCSCSSCCKSPSKDCCKCPANCCKCPANCCKCPENCCKCDNCCKCRCFCGFDVTVTRTRPMLFIMNEEREILLTINEDTHSDLRCCTKHLEWPSICDVCCEDTDDIIYSLRGNDDPDLIGKGTVIGEVRKKYPGRFCPQPDDYQIKWPEDLDVKMKAVVMCAIFVLDKL